MRIYSERVPALSPWQAELALNRAGFDDASYRWMQMPRTLRTEREALAGYWVGRRREGAAHG
jgi:hypothetical protein